MTRQEIGDWAQSVISQKKNVILEWATGVGKTKQAIDAINNYRKENYATSVLIVVAEVAHINNWQKEFQKFGTDIAQDLSCDIHIICYDSLKKYVNQTFNILILDECHHSVTDLRLSYLTQITADKVIGLSATIEPEAISCLEHIYGQFTTLRVTLQEAIDWGILPSPKIVLVPLTLDNTTASETIVFTRGNEKTRKVVNCSLREKWKYIRDKKNFKDLELRMLATPLQKYNDFCNNMEYYSNLYFSTKKEIFKQKWLLYGSQRKTFLGLQKTEQALQIIQTIKGYRFICFCTNIEQAESLGNNNAIHSKKSFSQEQIDAFNKGEQNSLFVVNMLKEGQNLKDIEKGVIVQLDGNTRSFIQRLGRVLRAENPLIYIIYFKGTQDETYLNKALEGINKEYIIPYEDNN